MTTSSQAHPYTTSPIITQSDYLSRASDMTQYLVGIGRVLFSLLFILSGISHFSSNSITYAQMQGVPLAGVLVPFTGLMILIGGLSVALGYHARLGAILLALFLIPVTFVMHNFWSFADPLIWQMQFTHFMKNLALLGSTFLIMHFGSGPMSVDSYKLRHPSGPTR